MSVKKGSKARSKGDNLTYNAGWKKVKIQPQRPAADREPETPPLATVPVIPSWLRAMCAPAPFLPYRAALALLLALPLCGIAGAWLLARLLVN